MKINIEIRFEKMHPLEPVLRIGIQDVGSTGKIKVHFLKP
jgi:hypothetical protein